MPGRPGRIGWRISILVFFNTFSIVFFEVVFRGCIGAFFCGFCRFRGPRGGHFGGLFVKSFSFLPERGAP